jgi:hypothetical protein
MNKKLKIILIVLGVIVLLLLAIITGTLYWVDRTEKECWKHEAERVFEKYEMFKTRTDILRAAGVENDPMSNPIEIIENEINSCSLGSNGQTVVRFTFYENNELKTLQVFKNYISEDYQKVLIEERSY